METKLTQQSEAIGSNMTKDQLTREWHLDRNVTVALILAILGNAVTTVWWASSISSSIVELRASDIRHDSELATLAIGRESNANRITSLEAKGISIETKLIRIEDKLDRIIEKQNK